MRGARALLGLAAVLSALPAAAQTEEPFRLKGGFNNAVHRFFPDLDARLNAVRYARWRALEIAWSSGINPELDRRFSSSLLKLLAAPPRFPPEADRVAPRVAREALPIFRALRWGQTFEAQVIDVFASPDASASLTEQRLVRILDRYRGERYALAEPEGPGPTGEALRRAPVSARILGSGTRLFARAGEDLVAGDFGQQRWLVRKTIEDFDRSYAGQRTALEAPYSSATPTVASAFPGVASQLDRLARFRSALFDLLIEGGETPAARTRRDAAVRELARRYGLPTEGIGGD